MSILPVLASAKLVALYRFSMVGKGGKWCSSVFIFATPSPSMIFESSFYCLLAF
jgi:hypothetical protein